MSQRSDDLNPFDPFGTMRTMRDANMDAWSKMMQQFVNTEAYSQATGRMLDAYLTTSAPFRQVVEQTMTQVLTQFNMPTRTDVTRIAERLTNIEMRLDDLDAQITTLQRSSAQQQESSTTSQHTSTPTQQHGGLLLPPNFEEASPATPPTESEPAHLATPTSESETVEATASLDPIVEQISEPQTDVEPIAAPTRSRRGRKENQ